MGAGPDDTDTPLTIDLSVDGRTIARVLADQSRSDLFEAGIGNGHHAFGATIALLMPSGRPQILVAQRSDSGEVIDIAVRKAES